MGHDPNQPSSDAGGSIAHESPLGSEAALNKSRPPREWVLLSKLNRLVQQITTAPSSQFALQRACDCLVHHFGFHNASILTLPPEGHDLIIQAHAGACTPPQRSHPGGFSTEGWLMGLAVRSGQAVFVDDTSSAPESTRLPGMSVRSEAVIPLLAGERVLGLLNVDSDLPNDFSAADRDLLSMVAERVAVELERARLIDTLRHQLNEKARAEEEIRKSLSLMNAAFNSTADGLLCVDSSGKVSAFNAQFQAMWGIPDTVAACRDDGLLIKFVLDQLRQPAEFQERVRELYSQPEAVSFDVLEFRDGRVVERYSLPQRMDDGSIIGRVWSFREVTARRRTEEAQRQLESRLFQSQKMEALGTLAGGVAHDFNNILAAIMGNADLLRTTLPPDADSQECLKAILEASYRARKLIDQILSFARRGELQRVPVRLSATVDEAVRALRSMAPRQVSIRVAESPPDLWILADTTQIQQVLLNLGTNSLQAMARSGGTLDVAIQSCEAPSAEALVGNITLPAKPYARLTLRDTGMGMDPAIVSKVFDPFFTTKAGGQGTGLGLASVQGIMHSHDGGICLKSQVGVGTTFDLYFPRCNPPEPLAMPRLPAIAGAGQGRRILLVDDEAPVGAAVERMLRKLGYVAICLSNPMEALGLLERDPLAVDAMLTDLQMPGLHGLDLAYQVHRIRPSLPIAAMTGFSSDLSDERLRDCGIHGVLQKPFDTASMARCLGELFQKSN